MLAVTGGKGGVGKSTVAFGIARALARRGTNPVVVDADRDMPDLHRIAGVPREPGVRAFAEGTALDRAVHPPGSRTPADLIPSGPNSVGRSGVRVLPVAPGTDLRTLRRALSRIRSLEATILVDCPAGVGRDAALPLRVADRAVLVTTPTTASLRDAAKAAAMARALEATPVGVICTRTDEPPAAESLLDCPVVGCIPDTDAPLTAPAARSGYRTCASARSIEMALGGRSVFVSDN